ncbi:MAG TPA: ATP-dependent DNA helicase RecG [Acidimicrobiales bacterium]|nr:ATP-dependent DNA helicase RecG [Acidimicrobiales bacterium]
MGKRLRELEEIPVTKLKGVGPEREKVLSAIEVRSILDVLTHYPRRHIDKTKQVSIRDAQVDEQTWVFGKVVSSTSVPGRGRGKARTELRISDGSGYLRVTFFNQPWRTRQFPEGAEAMFFGKVTAFRGQKQLANPEIDLLDEEDRLQITPIYPQSDKLRLYSRDFRRWVAESLRRVGDLVEPLPDWLLERHDFIGRTAAFNGIHAPSSMGEVEVARRRLVFDELLRIQLALVLRKHTLEATSQGLAHEPGSELVQRFLERLPFELTGDQRKVIAEIEADLARPVPMHRLLQGDVGAGKTVVAVAALLAAVAGGHQGAFMAPTEVLAEQHLASIRPLLAGLQVSDAREATLFEDRPLNIELLTNRVTGKERQRILDGLADGSVDLLVGTHALIQEAVGFRSLGVVVIDEQHRFGVEQRAALRDKAGGGAVPDVLVMTATPIPRTAAMTVYGDLDVSVLGEKPAGRQTIATTWARGDEEEAAVWARVREEVAAGRQAYVVTPLIAESDKLEVASAEETYARLEAAELSGLSLGLLHGRLPAAEKEATMTRFRDGATHVLVATTVIEVGVDVPNATVMVVLDADRFGIAQLHQLRGRVGRGSDASYCFLVTGAGGAAGDDEERQAGNARLEALVRTDDGFELAEVDLEIRGEGTVFGERQKGRTDLKLASLRRDREAVQHARDAAEQIVAADPTLEDHPELADELRLFLDPEDEAFLFKS